MRKALRIVLWIVGGVFFLILLIVIAINTRPGKDFIRKKAVAFLRDKLKTEVQLGDLDYALPKMIVLRDLLLKDQENDTLISAHEIKVDISMLKLINSKVSIQQLYLDGVHAHIYRHRSDTVFNFDYIVKAFVTPSTDTTPTATDTTAALEMNLDKLVLHDVHFRMDDDAGGVKMAYDVGDLKLTMKELDPTNLVFRANKLYANNLNATIIEGPSSLPQPVDTSTAQLSVVIDADELDLNNVRYEQDALTNQFFMTLQVGKLLAHPNNIDINHQTIDIKDFLLANTQADIRMGGRSSELAQEVADTVIQENPTPAAKWRVTARDLNLSNIGFILNDEHVKRAPSGIDYSHLDIKNLTLDADHVNYTTDTISGNIQHLAASEQSGLDLRELKTNFEYNPQGAYLHDLYLQTDNTILQNLLEVHYPSLEALAKNPDAMQMNVHLVNSIIGIKDVLLFAPQLHQQEFFRKNKKGMLRLATDLEGNLAALQVNKFVVSGLGSTEADLSGMLYHVADPNKLSYNLNIRKLQSSRNDLETLLPPATLRQVRLPDRFGIAGTIHGNTQAYRPKLYVVTTDGNAAINGLVDMSRGAGNERYDLNLKTDRLNIGRIIRNPDLGVITAQLSAKGTGFDINTMNAAATGKINAAEYNNYVYHNIDLKAKIVKKQAKIDLNSNDANAHLSVKGTADLAGEYPAIVADAVIDSVDFRALHFSTSEMRFHGVVHADIPTLNPDYPHALVTVAQPILAMNGRRYVLDSIYLRAKPDADSGNNIVLNAQTLKLNLWGHTPLTRLGDIIQYQINKHYALTDSTYLAGGAAPPPSVPAQYDLQLRASIENNPVLEGLIPDLKDLDTVNVEAALSPQRLYLKALAPHIVYQNYHIEDAEVGVNGSDSALRYQASVDHFSQSSMDIWYARVSGQLDHNTLSANVSVADRDSNERFRVVADLQREGGRQVLHLQPGLMLNYQNWSVRQPNRIVFGDEGFYVNNFGISNGPESISVNSEQQQFNAPLKAEISNFLLSNLTQIISKDTLLANGVLGGTIDLRKFTPHPDLSSQLGITNFSVLGDTVGDVSIQVNSATGNALDAQVGVNGFGNDIQLRGRYFPEPVNGNNFDMRLALQPLSLAAFEGIAQHQIRQSSGYIRGDLHITGTAENPDITGILRTDQLKTEVSMLGTTFMMPDEKIGFEGSSLVLNNFRIHDSADNVARINGSLDFRKMTLGMQLRANNWLAVSATPQQNKDLYGRLLLTTRMDIKGPVAAPDIEGNLKVLEGTNLHITLPTPERQLQQTEGVVKFVDFSQPGSENILMPNRQDTVKNMASVPVGSNINLNVSTDEEAEFSVVIDEATGDFVRIRGVANLNTTVAPDGTLGLAGTYEIKDGFYQFSYNFIRRQFHVQPGSTILFAGDPMDAQLNVIAYYEANVPPYDLVSRQVQEPEELVYFKQRLPFQVQMKLSGPIMQPDLTFDIVLPDEKNYRVSSTVTDVVRARLSELRNTPSDLNKQVFALIILNRFVAEDPFQNGAGGGGAEAIARQSASRFLSEQLNKFASGLISGLDLTLDLQTSDDYTTGERRNRTDLSVGASKRLLNDRLTINVGNNFQLEGPRSNSTQGTSYIPGNIAIDYDLTSDRRYRVRFFRRDEQTGELEGNVISTGAAFIFQVDYNRFKQILTSRKKRREMRQERRQRRREQNQKDDESQAADDAKAALYIQRNKEKGTAQ